MTDFGAKKKKKNVKVKPDMDFDAEWDSIPNKPYIAPKEPTPPPPPKEPSPSPAAPGKSKKRKKNKPKRERGGDKGKSVGGSISEIYSADKTTHVIEYGIQHDEIRRQRAEVKAIKEKQRQKKAEQRRKEQEAVKRHQELLAQQRAQKKAMKHKKRKSIIPREKASSGSPSMKPEKSPKAPPEIPKPEPKKAKSAATRRKKTNDWGPAASKPKRRLSKLKSNATIEPTIDVYAKELALLKEGNVELKKQVKMGDFIKKKYDLLKNENTLFKQQVAVLNEENEALKEQNSAMNEELEELRARLNIKSPTENDKNQQIMNGTDKKNKNDDAEDGDEESEDGDDGKEDEESEETDGDDDNDKDIGGSSSSSSSSSNEWDEWEPDQICDWVITLDTKFKKYDKVLREKLHEEEMHGSLLGELDINDLDRYGIKSVKHKKAILVQLKKLTNADDSD